MKERITAYVLSIGFVLLIVALPAYWHNRDAEKYMSGQRVVNMELMEENAKRTAIELETNCNIAQSIKRTVPPRLRQTQRRVSNTKLRPP